jgi:hypothetical protein
MPQTLEEVLNMMLSASTREQVALAWEVARRWREEHPEDADAIASAGESLVMVESALQRLL